MMHSSTRVRAMIAITTRTQCFAELVWQAQLSKGRIENRPSSAQSGQSLDADLRNRLAACEEALDAVQTRLASIEAQVRLHGVDDELEDVSDANWASATRAVTDLDRQVAALRRRLPPVDRQDEPPPRPARAGWACCSAQCQIKVLELRPRAGLI